MPPDINQANVPNGQNIEQNTQADQHIPENHKSQYILFPLITLIALIVLIALGYGYKDRIVELFDKGPEKIYVAAREFKPEGSILLTLAPKSTNRAGIYSFDLATNTLTSLYTSTTISSITASSYKGSTSTILIATSATAKAGTNTPILQIATFNKDTNKITELTTSPTLFKRHPSYSSALNAVIFSAKDKEATTTSLGTVSDFNVYLLNSKGVEKKVGVGSTPVLIPDGTSAVVLRKEGLTLLNLTNGASQVIWPIYVGSAWFNAQFSVSPKGTFIAWSNPTQGAIFIMKVTSWSPFKGQIVQKLDTHAFWPLFSPDEGYLVYEEVDWGTEPSKPRLIIQDLITPQRRVFQDLDSFIQTAIFLSEWR